MTKDGFKREWLERRARRAPRPMHQAPAEVDLLQKSMERTTQVLAYRDFVEALDELNEGRDRFFDALEEFEAFLYELIGLPEEFEEREGDWSEAA